MRLPRGNVWLVLCCLLPVLFVLPSSAAPEARLSGPREGPRAQNCLILAYRRTLGKAAELDAKLLNRAGHG